MGLSGQEALTELAALVGAVEDRIVLLLEIRRSFDGHGPTDEAIGLDNLIPGELQSGQEVEVGSVQLLGSDAKFGQNEVVADGPAVENERQLERTGQLRLDALEELLGEALGLERQRIDVRAALEGPGTTTVTDDVVDLPGGVPQPRQRRRD